MTRLWEEPTTVELANQWTAICNSLGQVMVWYHERPPDSLEGEMLRALGEPIPWWHRCHPDNTLPMTSVS